jgi:hypothetical protein
MPSQSTQHTTGTPSSPSSVGRISSTNSFNNTPKLNGNKRAKVIAVYSDGSIEVDYNTKNYGRSKIGSPSGENRIYPNSIYDMRIPDIGENVTLVSAVTDPFSEQENPRNVRGGIEYIPNPIPKWHNVNTNKTLDYSTPGQISDTKINNVGIPNYKKSINGF